MFTTILHIYLLLALFFGLCILVAERRYPTRPYGTYQLNVSDINKSDKRYEWATDVAFSVLMGVLWPIMIPIMISFIYKARKC